MTSIPHQRSDLVFLESSVDYPGVSYLAKMLGGSLVAMFGGSLATAASVAASSDTASIITALGGLLMGCAGLATAVYTGQVKLLDIKTKAEANAANIRELERRASEAIREVARTKARADAELAIAQEKLDIVTARTDVQDRLIESLQSQLTAMAKQQIRTSDAVKDNESDIRGLKRNS